MSGSGWLGRKLYYRVQEDLLQSFDRGSARWSTQVLAVYDFTSGIRGGSFAFRKLLSAAGVNRTERAAHYALTLGIIRFAE